MEFGSQTIAEQKNTLRTWFARYFDDGMTKEDVENWFDTLGACTGKGEISVNKEKLTAYLMQTKGFSTGEDFVLSLSTDIEEADAFMKCDLTPAAVRTIHRYMASRAEDEYAEAPAATSTGLNAVDQSTAVGSAANTAASAMMSDSAAKALMKIAGSVNKKVPEMGEKYLTVCGAKKHARDYAKAKENEWADTGLFEAVVEMLYYMHESCDELIKRADDEVKDKAADAAECADFLGSLSDEIRSHAKINREKSMVSAIAKLLKKSSGKSHEECRVDIHEVTEKPWVVGSGYHIREDFELWAKQMTEIRYTPYTTIESIQEGMVHMLQKFQPRRKRSGRQPRK